MLPLGRILALEWDPEAQEADQTPDLLLELQTFDQIEDIEQYINSLKELFENLNTFNPVLRFEMVSEHYHKLYNPITKISNYFIENIDATDTLYNDWVEFLNTLNELPLSISRNNHPPTQANFDQIIERLQNPNQNENPHISVIGNDGGNDLTALIPVIHRLFNEAFGYNWGNTITKSLIEHKDSICLISQDANNAITGIALGIFLEINASNHINKTFLENYLVFHVCALATLPQVAGQGVGRNLLDNLLSEARESRFIDYSTARIRETNVASKRLFENEGFVINDPDYDSIEGIHYCYAVSKESDTYPDIPRREISSAFISKGKDSMGGPRTYIEYAKIMINIIWNRVFY